MEPRGHRRVLGWSHEDQGMGMEPGRPGWSHGDGGGDLGTMRVSRTRAIGTKEWAQEGPGWSHRDQGWSTGVGSPQGWSHGDQGETTVVRGNRAEATGTKEQAGLERLRDGSKALPRVPEREALPRKPPGPHLECRTGMEHLVRMLPMMTASLSVHVPDSHSGMRIPGNGDSQAPTTFIHRQSPGAQPLLPDPRKSPLLQGTGSLPCHSPSGTQPSPRGDPAGPPTLEPGRWLEQSLLQSHVQVEVEPLVLSDVVPDPRQQHQVVEPLGHPLLQVGGKYPGNSKARRDG